MDLSDLLQITDMAIKIGFILIFYLHHRRISRLENSFDELEFIDQRIV
jgi:hypothetical protein